MRLFAALLAGAAIGYGRALKKVNASLRTYMLVSLGAALTVLISMYEYQMLAEGPWKDAFVAIGKKFDGTRFSALDHVLRYCKDKKFIIRNLQVTGDAGEMPTYTAIVTLRPRKSVDRAQFEKTIRETNGVLSLREVIE